MIPRLNTNVTKLAPQRKAAWQQSAATSPAPTTTTFPLRSGKGCSPKEHSFFKANI
jgi:hypothetical protein